MKIEDSTLIEKFLEGSINESESQSLLEKIESKQIPIDELKVVIDMHGILYSEFHLDSQANNLHKIVARAISTKKPSLSDRVIRRIETKKQLNGNQPFKIFTTTLTSMKKYIFLILGDLSW